MIVLKRLAILGIWLSLAVPAMADQKQPTGDEQARQSQQCLPSPTAANNQHAGYDQQPSDDKPHGWHKLIAWPEGITTWAVMFTLGAIIWQSYETRKAAEAALLNAQAIINAERAWLTITIQKDASIKSPTTKFVNVLLNEGRTPARLKTIHIDQTFASSPDQLPIPPRYKGVIAVPENMFVVGNNGFPIGITFDPKKILFLSHKMGTVENAQEFLIFYGRITYEDVFNVKGGEVIEHETCWCYAWTPWEGGKFVKAGPAEYNRNT